VLLGKAKIFYSRKGEIAMKKIIIIFVALLLVSSFFLLTGGKDKEAPVAKEGMPYAGQKITALYFSATYADAAKAYAPEFKELTGIELEVVDFPYLTLYEKMGIALSTGDKTYDVVTPACQWDGEFEPYLEDLEPYIERDNWDSEDIIPGLWEQSGNWAGKIMGIPFSNTPQTCAYRTDLIKEIPDTWDEFFKMAEKFHDPANGFYAMSIPGVKEQFGPLWMNVHWALGGKWADEDWNIIIDSPETRKALRIARKWYDFSDPAAAAWGLPESDAAFLNGNAALTLSWPTLAIAVHGDDPEKSKVVGKWAIGLLPYEKTGLTNLSSWDISITKTTKNKDAAWEWIKFYTSKEKQLQSFVEYSILPSRKSVWQKPEVKNHKLYPHLEASERGALIWWRIPAGTMSEVVFRDAISNYVTDQWDMERAVSFMEEGLKKVLGDYPPPEGVKNLEAKYVDDRLK
jgi:ABC-type glycerol-3-phosphate transport system substrate-binding protein